MANSILAFCLAGLERNMRKARDGLETFFGSYPTDGGLGLHASANSIGLAKNKHTRDRGWHLTILLPLQGWCARELLDTFCQR